MAIAIQTVAAGVLRDNHMVRNPVTGAFERSTLVEGQRTTYAYHSEPTDAQVQSNSVTLAAGFAGLARSHAILANGSTAYVYLQHGSLNASVGQRRPVGLYVIMDDGLGAPLVAQSGANTGDFSILVQGGVSPLEDLQIRDLGGGVYRISGSHTLLNLADSNWGMIRYGSNRQRAFRVGGYMMPTANARNLSSYIRAEGSQTSRAVDIFTLPYSRPPELLTVYVRMLEEGTAYGAGSSGVLSIANAGATGARLILYYGSSANKYSLIHNNGSTSLEAPTPAAKPALGNLVELRCILYADGSIQIGQTINGGVESLSVQTAANALAAAWGTGARVVVNDFYGTGGNPGFNPLLQFRIESGNWSRADMRALSGVPA